MKHSIKRIIAISLLFFSVYAHGFQRYYMNKPPEQPVEEYVAMIDDQGRVIYVNKADPTKNVFQHSS